MTEPVIRRSNDPVYVRRKVELIELRIGDEGLNRPGFVRELVS